MNTLLNKLKGKQKFDFVDVSIILLLIICIGQFIWMAYENLFNLSKYIEYDASMNLLYAVVASKQGRLVATDFECTTGQFISPLISLFYRFTNNIFISQGIGNILGTITAIVGICLVALAIYDDKRKVVLFSVCTTALIICPFTKAVRCSLDFGSVMSFPVAFYSRHVLMLILILAVLGHDSKIMRIKIKSILLNITICISLIIDAISGYEFLLVNIIIPLLICVVIEICVYNDLKKAICPKSLGIYVTTVCVFIGAILKNIFTEQYSATSDMHWVSLENFTSHVAEVLTAYIDIAAGLPGNSDTSVFSISGFSYVSGLIIIALLLLAFIYAIVKLTKDFSGYQGILPFVVVVVFCTVFYSVFDLTYSTNRNSGFSARYLIIAFVSLFFIFAKFISELDFSKIYSKLIMVVFIIVILIMTVSSDYYRTTERKDLSRLDEIKTILDDNAPDSKLVYFVGSNGNDVRYMRVWDTDRVYKDIWSTGELYHWGDYTYSDEASDDQGVYVIFCNKECVDTIPPYVSSRVERIGEWDDYNIYIGEETVYDFKTSCDGKIGYDFPYSPSITIDHMEMNEKGEYISDGSGNIIVYGPNYHFKEGIYDITLEYEVLESKDNIAGVFDMVKDEKELFTSTAVTKDAKTVGFYDVPISEETWLQYRVGEAEGTVLKINKVVIKCH